MKDYEMKATANALQWIFCYVYQAILFVSISLAPFLSTETLASPASLTYQGRILKSDGAPLEYNNVSFIFQITDPAGTCVIYQEQVTGYNMTNSAGVFDIPIGKGAIQYPLGGTTTVLDMFNNSGSFNCGSCSFMNGSYTCVNGTGSYNASSGDIRKLRVSFYDGSGWRTITPDNTIRSVPFAGYALAAEKLGTNVASDFLLKAGLPTCSAGTFLSYNGSSLSCAPVAGASGGTVTNVTSSNSYLTVINNTSTPTLTVNVGATANTVAAGDDPRFSDARTPTGAAGGVLNGSYPNPGLVDNSITNSKITDGAVSTSKLFSNPGVNRLVATDATTGSSLSALTCVSGQLLTWNIATGWQCANQNSLAVGSATTASSSTNFTGSLVGDVTGTQGSTSVDKIKGVPVDFSVAPLNGQVLKFNGTNWAPAIDSNAGGTVTSVSGTAPISVSTGTSTPVISISQATTSTNGYLSSADWNTFNNKQSALGFTPLNPANNLSDVSSVTTSRTNLGLGTAAVKNVPAAGNAAATEVVLGNDSRLSDSRTPTGSAGGDLTGTYPNPTLTTTGVTAGTYPKVTVDVKGRVTAGANLSAADIPNLDWSKITTGKPTTLNGYGITDSLVVNGGNTGSISSGLDNGKPASPASGDLFIATDVKRIYRYNGTAWDQLADASSSGGITALTGDVSATGPGSSSAIVNSVGGKTSTAVATSVNDTVAATSNNTNSTIVKRDVSGNFAASNATLASVVIKDGQATPNTVTLQVPATVTASYILKFPNAQGSSNQLMINDGSGNLSWTTLSSLGGVTSVTAAGTAGNPISIGGTATAPTVDIAKATSTTNGYLSSADWTIFNSKQNASLSDAKIWVGQTGTPTAVTLSGDISMTNAGVFTVTGIRGKTVSITAPSSAGQVLRYDGTSTYVPNFLGLADIKSTITPFGGAFANAACTAGQSLYWQSSTDTFQCQNVAINDSQLGFTASRTANTFLAAPNGSAGAATFRTITSADLPAGTLSGSGTSGYVPYYSAATTLANSPISISGNNVGIGTTSAAQPLHIQSTNTAGVGFEMTSSDTGGRSYGLVSSGSTSVGGAGKLHIYDFTSPKSMMVFDSSGNVGVGTTSPGATMDILSTVAATNTLISNIRTGVKSSGTPATGFGNVFQFFLDNSANAQKLAADFGTVWIDPTAGSEKSAFMVRTGNAGIMAERLRVDNNGNVGIGTTAPGRGIVAAPVVDVQIPYAKTDTSIRYGMFIGGNDTYPLGAAFYTVGAASSSGRSFNIQATELGSSINSLNLNPQGANVGIGTTVPGTTLDIRNPSAANGVNSSIFHAGVGTDATLGPLFFEVWGNPSATAASRYMGIVAADWSTVRPLILNTATNGVKGNVGIGTTSPSTTLQVSGTTTLAGGDFQFLDAGVADSTAVRLFSNGGNLYLQNGSGGATYIRSKTAAPIVTVLDGGTVGIGTTTPAHKLEVNGQIAVQSIAGRQGVNGSSNGSAFNFWWDGSCVHIWVDYTDFSISCPSDERVKTSIQSVLNTEGIDLVEKLKPVSYKWKKSDADKGIHYGFLAQEVQKILPAVVKNTGLISNDTPDGMLRIDYEQFIPILTKAIQDLKKESNELHGTCKASEDQMNAISRELASINDKTSKLEAENAKLKANDSAKDQKIHKLEQENAAIKAYLCGKDPGAGFCH